MCCNSKFIRPLQHAKSGGRFCFEPDRFLHKPIRHIASSGWCLSSKMQTRFQIHRAPLPKLTWPTLSDSGADSLKYVTSHDCTSSDIWASQPTLPSNYPTPPMPAASLVGPRRSTVRTDSVSGGGCAKVVCEKLGKVYDAMTVWKCDHTLGRLPSGRGAVVPLKHARLDLAPHMRA